MSTWKRRIRLQGKDHDRPGTDKCRGIGYVTFSMEDDAQRALSEVRDYDGQKIVIAVAKKRLNNKKEKKREKEKAPATDSTEGEQPRPKEQNGRKQNKKARLVIRNLSFKCSEDDLKETFSQFGVVLEVSIPRKPDGKMRGFAFVQFRNMLEAGKALAATNLKEIKGRQVAVDWAVAKDKFVAAQPRSSEPKKGETVKKETVEQASDHDNDSSDDSEDDVKTPKKRSKVKQEQEISESDDEDEDDDDERQDESHKEDSDDSGVPSDEDEDDDDSEDDDDDDDDDSEDDDASKKKKSLLPSDVNEGRTIFIRNLSFDTEEEGLEEALLQYGELKYVRIVLHPDTETSKGCAFAQFKTKEAADRCLAASQDGCETGGIRLDGRRLIIAAAVSREDAERMKTKKVKMHTGSRNLYLAREGLIRAGSKAAEGVPEADMAKRARFEELKRVKLRDVNVFVSKTRLCVHNLPKSVQPQQLRTLCLKAVGGAKGVRITECRVMYDKKPERGQVAGRSLGYGFVQFQQHEHALDTLRHLNNNPDIFGPNKRPIVEFSLEDRRKLKLQEKRRQQNMKPQGGVVEGAPAERGKKSQQQKPAKGKTPLRETSGTETKGGNYSGFRTKPEAEQVELEDGKRRQKVLPLPSKRGPKIRNRDKGKQPAVQPQKPKNRPSRKEQLSIRSLEKSGLQKKQTAKPGKRKFRNREDDRFDSLVEQYKRKLMGGSDSKSSVIKKSKWFSS
ncbi:RNA-binding protein 28 isoform X2 [Denticeps clupeoides]|uniref:RNA-binding protein 28 isoform X2 n=1 Tax=Denticeps clupeoides TaxID=299321 RepID=UPI0010A57135|nr:RNA-binding protein 28 isoform X2 [Denticeps clupeoides]